MKHADFAVPQRGAALTDRPRFAPLFAAITSAGACLCFLLGGAAAADTAIRTVQMLMQCAVIALIAGAAAYLYANKRGERRSYDALALLILSLGVVMRVGYMLYTPAPVRQHDLGQASAYAVGHAGYILRIAEGSLPATNTHQLYHPPFYHALAAAAVRLYKALTGITDGGRLIEAGKVVSCCASIITLMFSLRLIRLLKLSDRASLIALCVAAFLPNHYLLAGRVNNDAVAVMFMTAIVYYTLVWYRRQTMGGAIALAVCFGLGMMTKLSVGMLAFATGGVMLWALFLRIKAKENPLGLVAQLAVFAAIAFPLALWYPIRNLALYGQPLNYVLRPESDLLFTGNYSLWQRLGVSWNANLYNRPLEDYNLWQYAVRGAVFGEFSYSAAGRVIPQLLRAGNIALVALSFAGCGLALRRMDGKKWILLAFYAAIVLSFVGFYLEYPYGCTMDFRYIVPTALLGALATGFGLDALPEGWPARVGGWVVGVAAAAFSVLSVVMYCNI